MKYWIEIYWLSFPFFFLCKKTLPIVDPQHVHMKSVRRTVQIPLDSPARKQFPLHFLMHSLILLRLLPKQLSLVRYSGWYARSRPRPILIPLSNPSAICFIGIWHRKWGNVGTERSFLPNRLLQSTERSNI